MLDLDQDGMGPGSSSGLDRVVDDQALAVLAAIDDLRHDLPGSIHDARVALRKLRSTLIIFRPLLDRPAAKALDRELSWLTGELGTARDAQVVRSRITTAIRSGGAGEAGEVLLARLDQNSEESWERARAVLDDARTEALTVALEQVRLRSIVPPDPVEVTPVERLDVGLDDLVDRAVRVVGRTGRHDEAGDQTLHRLRKRVKRIRFAVASVSERSIGILSVESGAGRVMHALEDLQDLLGEYQDTVVTAAVLDRLGADAPAASATVARDLAAGQRREGRSIRDNLPGAVKRVRKAVRRLHRRVAEQRRSGRDRPPGVHLGSS